MSDDPVVVEAAVSADGSKRWRLLRRPNGLYAYEEETHEKEVYWVDEDGGERDVAAAAYWARTHVSGLFGTSEAARTDALGTLSWLRVTFVNMGTSDS